MKTKIPFPTKEQLKQLSSIIPTHQDSLVVDHKDVLEMCVYSYRHSPIARAYIDLLLQFHGKQAQIDALMFEWEPENMTAEQVEEWGRRQKPCAPDLEAKIKLALGITK